MSPVGTNPELKELLLCSRSVVDGRRQQSGVKKDSFMDLLCSVVKVKLRGSDKTMEAHWSVNTLKTIACCLFSRHLFDSLSLFVRVGRTFRE